MINFEQLLKLRVAVARYGEMDAARWWNTKGQLGPLGASVLRRGFPRTYRFAAARSVFAVAAQRCVDTFDSPGSITLWKLPPDLEETFEARWEHWLDNAPDWEAFFLTVQEPPKGDFVGWLEQLDLLTEASKQALAKVKRAAEGRAVPLPAQSALSDPTINLLAAAFSKGEPGSLAVPYTSLGA